MYQMSEAMKKRPSQVINFGIMEQTMIGFSAGIAKGDYYPIIYSITPFLIDRAYEQIKIDINFMNVDLSLVKKTTNIKKNIKHIRKKFFFELPKKNKIDDRPRPIINVPALNSSPINPETLIFLYLVSIPKIFCLKISLPKQILLLFLIFFLYLNSKIGHKNNSHKTWI